MEIIKFETEEELGKIITHKKNAEKLFVIDCGATWCAPCKRFGKFYREFVKGFNETDTIIFSELDVDKHDEFCKLNEIKSVPTILFVKDAEVIDRLTTGDPDKFMTTLKKLVLKDSK